MDERTPNSPCQGQEELLAKYNWEQSGDEYQFVSDQGDDVVTSMSEQWTTATPRRDRSKWTGQPKSQSTS